MLRNSIIEIKQKNKFSKWICLNANLTDPNKPKNISIFNCSWWINRHPYKCNQTIYVYIRDLDQRFSTDGSCNFFKRFKNHCFNSPIKDLFSKTYYKYSRKISVLERNHFCWVEEVLNLLIRLLKCTAFL